MKFFVVMFALFVALFSNTVAFAADSVADKEFQSHLENLYGQIGTPLRDIDTSVYEVDMNDHFERFLNAVYRDFVRHLNVGPDFARGIVQRQLDLLKSFFTKKVMEEKKKAVRFLATTSWSREGSRCFDYSEGFQIRFLCQGGMELVLQAEKDGEL